MLIMKDRPLFHTMACFYVIYRYVFFEWRLIRQVEINQYDITMATHYNITMDNDIARDAHCEITMGNNVALGYPIIMMSQWVMTLLCVYIIVLWTCEISLYKNNSCVLPRVTKHSLVLVIISLVGDIASHKH